jgi:hypothetical protein
MGTNPTKYPDSMDRHKVFISWSGPRALAIAKVWSEVLGETFDAVDTFVSDDIEAGARGLDEIQSALNGTNFAIVIVTRANEKAPWLNFEAGAISKQFPGNTLAKVVPCLVDFESPAELTTPLKQFQAKVLDQDGVEDTLRSIANQVGVVWSKKRRQFERAWPEYQKAFDDAREVSESVVHGGGMSGEPEDGRSEKSMIEEVLEILRAQQRVRTRKSATSDLDGVADDLVDYVEKFMGENSTDAGRISVGVNRDSSRRLEIYIDVENLTRNQLSLLDQQLSEAIKAEVSKLRVGSDGEFKAEITSCDASKTRFYPF